MSVNTSTTKFSRNGDQIVGFVSAKEVKLRGGFQDWASLHEWYQEDPLKNHMKMRTFFGEQGQVRYQYAFTDELLKNKQILEVNGWEGEFTYDQPIESFNEMITVADTSSQKLAGMSDTTFKLVLNEELAPNTTLTADGFDGLELYVSDSEPVRAKGDGYEHTVGINTNDPDIYYDSALLTKGVRYTVTGHGIGEFGTDFAKLSAIKGSNYMTCRFQLGSPRGVEAFVTGKADSKNLGGGVAQSKEFFDKLQSGGGNVGDLILNFDVDPKTGMRKGNGRIGAAMEYLVMVQLDKITANSHLFQRAGRISSNGGAIRYNEGAWHQMRRGYVDKYGRKGGITREHLRNLSDYVFRANTDLPTTQRHLKVKAGSGAFENLLEIFDDEFRSQLQLNSAVLGADRVIPKSPVSGDLFNLKVELLRVTEIFIKGVGNLKIEEDTSLNKMGLSDRRLSGSHQNNYDHTAWSVIVWDATSPEYSNNTMMPKGTTLVENGKPDANIYMVKPEGEYVYWGSSNGRYNIRKAQDVVSSFKEIGQEFWAFNNSAIFIPDVSRFAMLELDKDAAKGYN